MLFMVEGVLQRPLSDKVQGALLRGGSAFLMSAMIMLILYDSYSSLIPKFLPLAAQLNRFQHCFSFCLMMLF